MSALGVHSIGGVYQFDFALRDFCFRVFHPILYPPEVHSKFRREPAKRLTQRGKTDVTVDSANAHALAYSTAGDPS
jgi:hypothetical protein